MEIQLDIRGKQTADE